MPQPVRWTLYKGGPPSEFNLLCLKLMFHIYIILFHTGNFSLYSSNLSWGRSCSHFVLFTDLDSMNILEPEDEEHTQEEDSSGSNEDEDSQDEEEEEEEEEEDQVIVI